MGHRFQFAKADGHPDWTVGHADYEVVWNNVYDHMRFHTGEGFYLWQRSEAHPKPAAIMRPLKSIEAELGNRLRNNPLDTVFKLESVKDSFALVLRNHEVDTDKGQLIIAHAKNKLNTSYVFGVTDCSWLTMFSYGLENVELQHNAHLQHIDSKVTSVTRAQIKPGDLLFHHDDDHVSIFVDYEGPGNSGRVIDTEPHDTGAPSGWPTSRLGVGVQLRPMIFNYYCDWEHVNGIGRIVSINGKP